MGHRVRTCRQLSGLTQQQLGEAVGCSKSHISQIEQGLSLPSIPLLLSLARHLRQRPGFSSNQRHA
ncbi:MAG: helix-turn-helix domain-containing protein [Limnochordia bacterium]